MSAVSHDLTCWVNSGIYTICRIRHNYAVRAPLDEDSHVGNHGSGGGLTKGVIVASQTSKQLRSLEKHSIGFKRVKGVPG